MNDVKLQKPLNPSVSDRLGARFEGLCRFLAVFDIHAEVMTLQMFRICLMLVFRVYTHHVRSPCRSFDIQAQFLAAESNVLDLWPFKGLQPSK